MLTNQIYLGLATIDADQSDKSMSKTSFWVKNITSRLSTLVLQSHTTKSCDEITSIDRHPVSDRNKDVVRNCDKTLHQHVIVTTHLEL